MVGLGGCGVDVFLQGLGVCVQGQAQVDQGLQVVVLVQGIGGGAVGADLGQGVA